MRLFDAHCHLQLPQYDADRAEVLARMREQDMGALVIGVDYETSKAGLELATGCDFLWAAVGLHPNDNLDEHFDISKYLSLAEDPKVVAIGECGLDYYCTEETVENKDKQKERFLAHLALAQKVAKPLIIHCRNAHEDMLAMLAEHKPQVPVVIHFFTGSGELAKRYLALGCYLSFPGPVTYTDMYDESIRACPVERLLVETDSPFAAPVPHRGTCNEPPYVIEVAQKVAGLKGVSAEAVAAQVVANASAVFLLR